MIPKGYRFKIDVDDNPRYHRCMVRAFKGTHKVGFLSACRPMFTNGPMFKKDTARIDVASIQDVRHRGKGLGLAMYEAMYDYLRSIGVKAVSGEAHSTDAARVHQKLAKKHGYKYPYINGDTSEGCPFDAAFGPYSYSLE